MVTRVRKKTPVRVRNKKSGDEIHTPSPTAVAIEAARTGVLPSAPVRRDQKVKQIPGEDEKILVGDPDDDPLLNEYSGEDVPGGDSPTPDQNVVDEIGRAYGLEEEDQMPLQSGDEVLRRRDRKRTE
jgi:hypothetical protein